MNFFCTKKHLMEYSQKMNLKDADIFCLDAWQGLQVAEALFSL